MLALGSPPRLSTGPFLSWPLPAKLLHPDVPPVPGLQAKHTHPGLLRTLHLPGDTLPGLMPFPALRLDGAGEAQWFKLER